MRIFERGKNRATHSADPNWWAAIQSDPYGAYELIRETGSALYDSETSLWFIGRYRDVSEALRRPGVFSSKGTGPEATLIGADGEAHRRIRAIISPQFAKRNILTQFALVDDHAAHAVESVRGVTVFDFMEQVAPYVPLRVMASMLGIPHSDLGVLPVWTNALLHQSRARSTGTESSRARGFAGRWSLFRKRTKPEGAHAQHVRDCVQYLKRLREQASRGASAGWLLDHFTAPSQGLTQDEFIDLGITMILGATETTINLTGSAVYFLAKDLTLQEQVRRNPERSEALIEEVLRIEAPVQFVRRTTTCEAELEGVTIPAGATVLLLLAAANRDPAQFRDPDHFQIDRPTNTHVSFGAGPHFCVGAELARMEASAVVRHLLNATEAFELPNDHECVFRSDKLALRGPQKLEIKVHGWRPPAACLP